MKISLNVRSSILSQCRTDLSSSANLCEPSLAQIAEKIEPNS